MKQNTALDPYLKAMAQSERPPKDAPPREVEAWALTTTAQRLQIAAARPEEGQLRDALLLNQRLWTIFQADLLVPECPLPSDVRRNLVGLSLFVDRETLDRLSDMQGSKVQILADINISLAAGLRGGPEATATAARQSMQAVADHEHGTSRAPATQRLKSKLSA